MKLTIKIEDNYDKEKELTIATGLDCDLNSQWCLLFVGEDRYSVKKSELKMLLKTLIENL